MEFLKNYSIRPITRKNFHPLQVYQNLGGKVRKLKHREKVVLTAVGALLVLVLHKREEHLQRMLAKLNNEQVVVLSDSMDDQEYALKRNDGLKDLFKISGGGVTMSTARKYYGRPDVIWFFCNSTTERLLIQGHLVSPFEILKGSVEVVQQVKAPPGGNMSFQRFCDKYAAYRNSNPLSENHEPMNHAQAIDCMIQQFAF